MPVDRTKASWPVCGAVSCGRPSGLSSLQRAMGDLFHSQLELAAGTFFTCWKLHSVVQFRQRHRYAERAEVD